MGEVCRFFLFSKPINLILPPLAIRFRVMTSLVVVGDNILDNIRHKRGVRILLRDFLREIVQDIGGSYGL